MVRLAKPKIFELFQNSVKRQLISDVPVGSYLSGGMDTGSIVSVAKRYFERLTTFTVGFDLSSASGLELGFKEMHLKKRLNLVLTFRPLPHHTPKTVNPNSPLYT